MMTIWDDLENARNKPNESEIVLSAIARGHALEARNVKLERVAEEMVKYRDKIGMRSHALQRCMQLLAALDEMEEM